MIRSAVIDCSVASSWFLPDECSRDKDQILERILNGEIIMVVPDLWWYEMTNVLKSSLRRNRITPEEANKIMFYLKEIKKEVISSESQGQPGILNLSTITELSAYDATYLHLALSSGSDLVTSDKDLLALKESHGNIYTPEEYCLL